MGFELKSSLALKAVKMSVKEKDDQVIRRCRMTLQATFSEDIADALGDEAKKARKSLQKRGLQSAVIPIDSLIVSGVLKGNASTATISEMTGIKATATAGDEAGEDSDETDPTIALEWEFPFNQDAWVFLGKNCAAYVDVTFEAVQKELPGTEGPKGKAAKNGKGKKAKDDRDPADMWT